MARRGAVNPGADAGAVGFYADRLDPDPIVLERAVAAKKLRDIVHAIDQNIERAIVVEITDGAAAPGHLFESTWASFEADIGEMPVAQILVQHLALAIAGLDVGFANLGIDVAISDQDVDPAIVVKIDEADTPAKEARVFSEAGLKGLVFENQIADVAIKAGSVAGEIRFYHVEVAVAIVVGGRDAHSRLRLSVRAIGGAGFNGDIGERAVVIVAVKRRRRGVVGDVDIGPGVVVEVANQNTEAIGARRFEDAGFLADVGERAVAVVVKQDILRPLQAWGTAGHQDAFVHTRPGFGQRSGFGIEVDVVGDEKVQVAVLVVVDESTAGVPT